MLSSRALFARSALPPGTETRSRDELVARFATGSPNLGIAIVRHGTAPTHAVTPTLVEGAPEDEENTFLESPSASGNRRRLILNSESDSGQPAMMLHTSSTPPPAPTLVRFVVTRRVTLPNRAARAVFRLSVARPGLPTAVAAADGFLARAKQRARADRLSFRLRSYTTFRRTVYTPGAHPPPARSVYVVTALFSVRGPNPRLAAPLVERLAHRAYLLSFESVPALGSASLTRLKRALESRVLREARRGAVRACRLLGDRRAFVHRLNLIAPAPYTPPPRPLFARALVARGAPPPLPVATSRTRLTLRATVHVWCYPDSPPGS